MTKQDHYQKLIPAATGFKSDGLTQEDQVLYKTWYSLGVQQCEN